MEPERFFISLVFAIAISRRFVTNMRGEVFLLREMTRRFTLI
jgi:hypothetical protein